jgi:branched-chain amino acid aminotransferase
MTFSLPSPEKLGFGQLFTDHMFCLNYNSEKQWHDARVVPYAPLQLDPAASVLHYGQALFEGMKAFRQKDDRIVLFRPQFNCARLAEGAARLCMPAPPADLMLKGIRALVKKDHQWVPAQKGCALYIRPTLIGTEAFLGVRPSQEYLLFVILSPVGAYYQGGLKPIRIWVEEKYVRAAPGGLGATKAGANYAASLLAALEAKKKGYAQVLWLDPSHEFAEEVGTMNVFFVLNGEVITPALNGSILAGGVRESSIMLLREWGYTVTERRISMREITAAIHSGALTEAFGTGTAALISPVGELHFQNQNHVINERKMGEVSRRLYDEFTALQFGEKADTHGWFEFIDR